jgi:transposase
MKKHKKNIKKLRVLLRNKYIDLWSLDECHFQQHGSRCMMWIPPEDTDPIILHEPTRKSISVFGAVRIKNGSLVTQFSKPFNALTFQKYLELLLTYKSDSRRMHIILDNSRYHHAILLQPWLEKHQEEIQLDFLPPYSPELNPIERVWKLTRRLCTHNRYFPSLDDLTNVVREQFERWILPNTILQKLCVVN